MLTTIGFIFSLIAGLILLTAGRRLFWLFVAALGFVVGFGLAGLILQERSGLLILAIALIAGLLGALLAIGLQRVALAVAGFVAGGYILAFLVQAGGIHFPVVFSWLIGGVIGAALLFGLFDWALVFLSAAAGAVVLVRVIPWFDGFLLLKFAVLFVVGFVIQAVDLTQRRK
ncbi:MAG: hypothetical protein IT308_13355 [Anaerolineaceae bacterium]|nr:hypothetical protein [Anaerolineaceae bacterium]